MGASVLFVNIEAWLVKRLVNAHNYLCNNSIFYFCIVTHLFILIFSVKSYCI